MRGRVLVTLAAVAFIFSFVANAHAQALSRVFFNCYTQVQPQGNPPENVKAMQFGVSVTLNPVGHVPNYIKEITVTVPGSGQTFSLDPDKDYNHADRSYYKAVPATEFNNGIIPSGTYSATVVHSSGAKITEVDDVKVLFLDVAEITYPTSGATVTDKTPRFKWKPVKNATYYDVKMYMGSGGWGEPVFQSYLNQFTTDLTYADIPKGILKPGTGYSLRVEARNTSQDLDARSRSSWVNFTMGTW
jgi:hypothetical protein